MGQRAGFHRQGWSHRTENLKGRFKRYEHFIKSSSYPQQRIAAVGPIGS